MSMEYSHNNDNERFAVDHERLPEAERALEFAGRFGVDFQKEPDENITAAPAYLRRMVTDLQVNDSLEWTYGSESSQSGFVTHLFSDESILQVYVIHIPELPPDFETFLPQPPEIYIDMLAEMNERVERRLTYELTREEPNRVIRADIDLATVDIDTPTESYSTAEGEGIGSIDPELIRAISREAAMLREGFDPSLDLEIECLREMNEDFRQASDDQRERFRRKTQERQAGLNDQPIGIRELAALRRAILQR